MLRSIITSSAAKKFGSKNTKIHEIWLLSIIKIYAFSMLLKSLSRYFLKFLKMMVG